VIFITAVTCCFDSFVWDFRSHCSSTNKSLAQILHGFHCRSKWLLDNCAWMIQAHHTQDLQTELFPYTCFSIFVSSHSAWKLIQPVVSNRKLDEIWLFFLFSFSITLSY
jgi:hypothetical protein